MSVNETGEQSRVAKINDLGTGRARNFGLYFFD